MKTILFILFLFYFPIYAQLVDEGFETTGEPPTNYDVNNWGTSGTVNWDFTGDPLVGSESCMVSNGTSQARVVTVSSYAETYAFMIVRFDTLCDVSGAVKPFFSFQASTVAQAAVYIDANENIYIDHGTGNATDASGFTFVIDTDYYFWMHYVKGTGADGIIQVWASETPTKPALIVEVTNGSSTGDINRYYVWSDDGEFTTCFDEWYISETVIGDYGEPAVIQAGFPKFSKFPKWGGFK